MTPKLSCFYLARFVLQAETAFAVNRGLRDGVFDSLIVKDANNLPAIPGASLAGVLRHRFAALYGDQSVKHVFGYAEGDKGDASRLQVSWGCLHDQKNKPVEGIRFDANKDPVLERLQQDHPYHRERVSINEKGVAKFGSKFDQTVVPAGCRFSFEISYWSEQMDDPDWVKLLQLITLPLQIGVSTRSGLGWFKLDKKIKQKVFDLKDKGDWAAFKEIDFSLVNTNGWDDFSPQADEDAPVTISAELTLEAEDFWRFGQGGHAIKSSEKTPDNTPFIEPVIAWSDDNEAEITPAQVVVPASGVKGALAHRVQFHYRRIKGNFTCTEQDAEDEIVDTLPNLLFGFANNKDADTSTSVGQAGLILFKDVYLNNITSDKVRHLNHTSIDRFTGGVRDKVLFTEEVIWKQVFTLNLQIDPIRLKYLQQDEANNKALATFKQAFKYALDDLIDGRLALGAGAAKGHGYFTGTIVWTDNGKWIGGEA